MRRRKKSDSLIDQDFDVPLDALAKRLRNVKARVLPSAEDKTEMKLGRIDRLIRQKEEELALKQKLKKLKELEAELDDGQ